MKSYGKKYYLKKKVSYETKKGFNHIHPLFDFKLIHKIFNTINASLLTLVFILFFLSFNSQKEWSSTYQNLIKTKALNNNLIDYISLTEESYIGALESLENFKKTTPSDLIYLNRIQQKEENYLNKKIVHIINGFQDSKYQTGY